MEQCRALAGSSISLGPQPLLHRILFLLKGLRPLILGGIIGNGYLIESVEQMIDTGLCKYACRAYGLPGDFWNCLYKMSCGQPSADF